MWRQRTLEFTRPNLVEFMHLQSIIICNVVFQNSPFWNIHPVYCRTYNINLGGGTGPRKPPWQFSDVSGGAVEVSPCSELTTTHQTEVSSVEWETIKMTDQEEDLINRMHKLVGDRWDLIAGRVPGRKAEEIERFWIMKHGKN
ncbi:uncharacterized protein LOC130766297 isoform X2 [Actinidia eriantha]|uniref:uncharacterized protein LOC130766297 isoform X2 n=1 Tax=Actinidia eriantha TaxID=165200 RepID=UPI002588DF7F|nr:uncharacterized protein LOC130766297 isoform X2 [Actinidia eriantha]